MKEKTHLILPIFNLIMVAFILIDAFVIKPIDVSRIYDHTYSKIVSSGRNTSHEEFYLKPLIGNDIFTPGDNVSMNYGDTFFLQKTTILRRNLNIVYGNKCIAVGILNSPNWFMNIAFTIVIMLSIYMIFNNSHIKNPEYKSYYLCLNFVCIFIILGNYFIHY